MKSFLISSRRAKKSTGILFPVIAVMLFAGINIPLEASSPAVETAERSPSGRFLPDPGSPSGWQKAPTFSDDEEEDIGVQYLLLERPRHRWFDVTFDNIFSLTSNPLLLEARDASSTQNIFNLSLAVKPKPIPLAGGNLQMRTGVRLMWLNYGWLDDQDKIIAGLPIRSNNFESRSPFIEFSWSKGNWFAFAGLRFNSLVQTDNNGSSREFYHDYNPLWMLARSFALSDRTELWIQYTGDFRFSKTQSAGLLPNSWNDRSNHGLSLALHQYIKNNLILQGSYSFQYAHYFDSARDRNDTYNTFGAAILWAPHSQIRLRFFANYEIRRSNDPSTSEYEKFEGGMGAQFLFSF